MVLPADGAARPKPWRDSFTLVGRRAGVVAGRRAVRDARRRSVGHRSRARAGQGRACTRRRSRSWTCTRRGRRLVEEPHRRVRPIRSATRCGARTARRCSSAPSTTRPTTKRSTGTASPSRSSSRSPAGRSRSAGLQPTAGGHRRVGRGRRRGPIDLWMFGASAQRTRITDLNPQLGALHVQQAGAVLLPQRRRRSAGRAALQAGRPRAERQGAGDHLGLREDDAGHPPLRRARPDVHQPRLRDADAEREGEGRADRRLVREVRRAGGERGARRWDSPTASSALWGHSFGAYATSNLITRTDIFAAAVSGATPPELFRNWASGRDRDSRNIETGQARMGGSPFEFPERYLSQSAFFHLDKVNTPVLILHGEKDLTILFGEGEMMFYALRQLGKTAEFVVLRERRSQPVAPFARRCARREPPDPRVVRSLPQAGRRLEVAAAVGQAFRPADGRRCWRP